MSQSTSYTGYCDAELEQYTREWYKKNKLPYLKGPDWKIELPKYGIYVSGETPVETINKFDNSLRNRIIEVLLGKRNSIKVKKKYKTKM